MGRYNTIKDFSLPCPKCGFEVTKFKTMEQVSQEGADIEEVNNFYSICQQCGAWIEFTRHTTPRLNITPMEYASRYFRLEVDLKLLQPSPEGDL